MRYVFAALIIPALVFLAPVAAEEIRHEVKPGETLYGIAREYGISVRQLTEINRIESPDLLLPGTILSIGREYRVQAGDTLYGIARSNDTTVAEIQGLNNLDSTTIVTGQRLRLPLNVRGQIAHSPSEASETPAPGPTREPAKDREQEKEQPPESPPRDERRLEVLPVALSLEEQIPFAEGGSWPVTGRRTRLEGKLPGVLIRAERGAPVAAIASGRVVYAGPHSTFGNVVFIQSSQGYIYIYGGQERILVDVGDAVSAGGTVGTVGTSPNEGGAALYFSVWRNNSFVDPESAPRG